MRCVPLKSHEQLALQATHRVRQRFIVERTATVNQMRALLLEYGLTVPVGRKVFERSLPTILEDAENGLPDFIRALVLRLRERWQQLDIQIDDMSLMLGQASSASGLCQKISTVPGIGPIVSTALIAAIGNAHNSREPGTCQPGWGLSPSNIQRAANLRSANGSLGWRPAITIMWSLSPWPTR